jgi:hypothetical protein
VHCAMGKLENHQVLFFQAGFRDLKNDRIWCCIFFQTEQTVNRKKSGFRASPRGTVGICHNHLLAATDLNPKPGGRLCPSHFLNHFTGPVGQKRIWSGKSRVHFGTLFPLFKSPISINPALLQSISSIFDTLSF